MLIFDVHRATVRKLPSPCSHRRLRASDFSPVESFPPRLRLLSCLCPLRRAPHRPFLRSGPVDPCTISHPYLRSWIVCPCPAFSPAPRESVPARPSSAIAPALLSPINHELLIFGVSPTPRPHSPGIGLYLPKLLHIGDKKERNANPARRNHTGNRKRMSPTRK